MSCLSPPYGHWVRVCMYAPAGLVKPTRDWRKLGGCLKVIEHSPQDGRYVGVAVNNEGLLAIADQRNLCVYLLSKEGALVRSIGKGVLGSGLFGVAFDPNGNVWVTDWGKKNIVQLSQDGRVLQTIQDVSRKGNRSHPLGLSVSPEGLIYKCDMNNHHVTVHDEEGKFLFTFGSLGHGPGCFKGPHDVTFGSDDLVYVTDTENRRVCVWSKGGIFMRYFQTKCTPTCIAATGDNHLVITSHYSHTVMVYTVGGQLVHEFGGRGSDPGRFSEPDGICVDESGLVYVADYYNSRVQVF